MDALFTPVVAGALLRALLRHLAGVLRWFVAIAAVLVAVGAVSPANVARMVSGALLWAVQAVMRVWIQRGGFG